MRKKLLLVGAGGMLARDLEKATRALPAAYELVARTHSQLDIRDRDRVLKEAKRLRPDVIVNCAAYTDVDGAESHPDEAFAVNCAGVENLASAARDVGSLLVHISTDFVFDGRKEGFYVEEDEPNPISTYARSKYEGEERVRSSGVEHLIVRTGWLYGERGNNFVKTIRRLALEKGTIRVVCDQRGSPTWSVELSEAILSLLAKGGRGTFHAVGEGACSRKEFAEETVRLSELSTTVEGISTKDYDAPARRPQNSALSTEKLFRLTGFRFRPWKEALADFIKRVSC